MGFLRRHFVIILALALILIAGKALYDPPDKISGSRRVVVGIAGPIQEAVVAVVDGVASLWNGYIALWNTEREAEDLRDINRRLSRQIADQSLIEQENARLRRLLGFTRRVPLQYSPARVIATNILSQFRSITINTGRADGLSGNPAVVTEAGVVGRVIELHDRSARVLLMIDSNSSIDGLVRRTGARGIIQGVSERDQLICQFAFSLRTEDVRAGDEIITSGLDQQFPAGLLLGRVVEVSRNDFGIFQEAKIEPAVDFSRLNEVLLVTGGGWRR